MSDKGKIRQFFMPLVAFNDYLKYVKKIGEKPGFWKRIKQGVLFAYFLSLVGKIYLRDLKTLSDDECKALGDEIWQSDLNKRKFSQSTCIAFTRTLKHLAQLIHTLNRHQ